MKLQGVSTLNARGGREFTERMSSLAVDEANSAFLSKDPGPSADLDQAQTRQAGDHFGFDRMMKGIVPEGVHFIPSKHGPPGSAVCHLAAWNIR
jgi:hypothetical protein